MSNARGIGILGAGRWGMTLAHVLASGGTPTWLWDKDGRRVASLKKRRSSKRLLPELTALAQGVQISGDAEQVCEAVDTLLIASAATEVRGILSAVGAHIGGHHAVVHAVRGLEAGSLVFPSHIIRQETCARRIGALLGPVLVEDLLAKRPSAGVVASRFPAVRAVMVQGLASPTLRIYTSDDLPGVETAAAGAAVGAIAIGLCLELGLGAATLAAFVTRGTAELARVCAAAGGKQETAFGLAGLGDLISRRESDSREVQAGRMLARGATAQQIEAELGHLDAVDTAQTFADLAQRRGIQAHLTLAVGTLLAGKASPQQVIAALMNLQQMDE